jgi:hypothetical protein
MSVTLGAGSRTGLGSDDCHLDLSAVPGLRLVGHRSAMRDASCARELMPNFGKIR